jgi:CRISPR-associated endonuclease/helicase Cas3
VAATKEYLAHPGHPLTDHLLAVAELAKQFAAGFDSGEWGYLAGLWHDLGKFQDEFQRRLHGDRIAVEHSGAGAAHALATLGNAGLALAAVIAGHHCGLANVVRSAPGGPTPLRERLASNVGLARRLTEIVSHEVLSRSVPAWPQFLDPRTDPSELLMRVEFWTRFLFSALTDADYLDTEYALDPARAERRVPGVDLAELLMQLETAIEAKQAGASRTLLQQAREEVAESCRTAASQRTGVFSLTAPTGSGKTLAAMRFALHHAKCHGLRRVVVVLPYTSIIEQNAAVYRGVFGEGRVLEHHSSLDPEKELERKGEELTARHRLASENWDAPIIVTTTVQFFESLFSNRGSRCRKLHNISGSVVILDEVQSLPPGFLVSVLDSLKELTSHYGCSVVLSTATPPALAARESLPFGLPDVREILPDPARIAHELRRVRYHWPETADATAWDELAGRIIVHRRALAVVHLRRDARVLTELLRVGAPEEPIFHLSAAMCAAHRSEVLVEVRNLLDTGAPCRLVSTQLIEAGVDIDFPVLFRAMAGLDSIVQAAGRCNREGKLQAGEVHLFEAPTQPPAGVLRRGLETMRVLLAGKGAELNPSDPETCLQYFRMFYSSTTLDSRGIQAERRELNFATVAEEFRLIEDQCTVSVVVPYGDAEERVRSWDGYGSPREWLRRLQPYVVRVYPRALSDLMKAGAIEEIAPGVHWLLPPFRHLYDITFGLNLSGELFPDAASLII